MIRTPLALSEAHRVLPPKATFPLLPENAQAQALPSHAWDQAVGMEPRSEGLGLPYYDCSSVAKQALWYVQV